VEQRGSALCRRRTGWNDVTRRFLPPHTKERAHTDTHAHSHTKPTNLVLVDAVLRQGLDEWTKVRNAKDSVASLSDSPFTHNRELSAKPVRENTNTAVLQPK